MAFEWGDALNAAVTLYGAKQGSKKSTDTQTATKELDPRIAQYVYGPNGQGGLLGSAQDVFKDQMAQGGLNPTQRQGLDMQRQVLMSPQYTQGFDAMRRNGMGLMSAGVAGNPFMQGQQAQQTMSQIPQQPQPGTAQAMGGAAFNRYGPEAMSNMGGLLGGGMMGGGGSTQTGQPTSSAVQGALDKMTGTNGGWQQASAQQTQQQPQFMNADLSAGGGHQEMGGRSQTTQMRGAPSNFMAGLWR